MIIEFKFNKKKILFAIFILLLIILFLIYFISKPENFISYFFLKAEHIQIIGIIGLVFFYPLFYSILKLISKKYAIQITDEFLLDNSKYESIGKIEWKDISKIQRLKKKSIELFINKSVLQNRSVNYLEKYLLFMHNWNYSKSIIITSAYLNCSVEELYDSIILAYENHYSKNSCNLKKLNSTNSYN